MFQILARRRERPAEPVGIILEGRVLGFQAQAAGFAGLDADGRMRWFHLNLTRQ